MGSQLLNAAGIIIVVVALVFVALVGAGFWLLARRKATGGAPNALEALEQRANILLVRVDDAVKNGEDELGYAIAQFGNVKSQEFESVLATAKDQLREAFGLQQKLDDAYPESETQRREWNSRIIHLCESAQSALEQQELAFAGLRTQEKNAPENLAAARRAIDAALARKADAGKTLAGLNRDFSANAVASVADNVDRATSELSAATSEANRAETILGAADTPTAGNSPVDAIRAAEEHAYRAGKLFDAITDLRTELDKTVQAATALRESTRDSLGEARAVRDAPPDAAVGSAVGRAIETVEAALAVDSKLRDPLATLEVLRSANAELDASMASARNQQQRLSGARIALVGALVGARSQIAATRNFIDTRRGGVGHEARTRLAEAERLLAVAEAESDPVAALDTARSSATYSRDADALARFDLQRR
ncbi:MAG: hypothetical protein J0H56_10660 [Micrococcales bacterium]|nr:hypothetical protein [Micrococcales bacterium]